ncbi:hypothetical protein FB45DRAFT_953880 [Roridomyces roridus]|uniref:Uncharacterized protein n=1 Tax=Roridomyces roridus TaxID=1738132 RepID=A0AAD7AZ79_9AGAR|nr:hypothetical protein FB45DRAFT_953880 [Roridomyces roridus]
MTLVLPQVWRRVESWIDPFIYERVAIPENYKDRDPISSFLATVDVRPATFFGAHVKHIHIDRLAPLHAVQRILAVCTSVVSFGCHQPYTVLAPLLSSLPLTRLLVSELSFPNPSPLPDWSSTLTHLGLSSSLPASASTTLAHLSSLTHLAVDYSCTVSSSSRAQSGFVMMPSSISACMCIWARREMPRGLRGGGGCRIVSRWRRSSGVRQARWCSSCGEGFSCRVE